MAQDSGTQGAGQPPASTAGGGQASTRAGQAAPAAATPRRGVPRRVRLILLVAAVAVVAGALLYWLHARQYEDTDDAQIDGHIHPISARINGTVIAVNPEVRENHFVAAGTVLVEIDPADYRAELARAQADLDRVRAAAAASQADIPVISANATGQLAAAQAGLAEARHAVDTERANLRAALAKVQQAQAQFHRAEDDRKRYAALLDKQEISRSEYEQRATDARNAQAALEAAQADAVAAENRVAQAESRVAEQEAYLVKARTAPQQISEAQQKSTSAGAEMARAQAQLETARLNLSYTRIVAPVSGIVGRKSVEVGQRVQPGQELLTIVQLDDIWVTANFKETQLRLMHPGQPAAIHVDAYGRDLEGHVESIAPATGARFSLLPPENATGNFVKVVQRLPVRIRIDSPQDPDHPLRPGMSVEATVKVR